MILILADAIPTSNSLDQPGLDPGKRIMCFHTHQRVPGVNVQQKQVSLFFPTGWKVGGGESPLRTSQTPLKLSREHTCWVGGVQGSPTDQALTSSDTAASTTPAA